MASLGDYGKSPTNLESGEFQGKFLGKYSYQPRLMNLVQVKLH